MAADQVTHADPHTRASLAGVTIASVAAAVAAAAVGSLLALGMVRSGEDAAALRADSARAPRAPAAVGQDVTTSFGVVAVQSITRSAGPTAKALAGVTHGIQNLIPPDKVQIVATVTLTNLRPTPVRYDPAQFTLSTARDGRALHVRGSSIAPGTLQPDASIDATVTFVAPRDGSKLWMHFRDPGAAKPLLFDLGRTDRTPPGALRSYHAHGR